MATISDGFKDVFLAGIGAMAVTGEKTKELVDQLIAKGEITVEQGREVNSELKHKAEQTVSAVRLNVLEAQMAAMTPDERASFVAKAAEIAARTNATEASADAASRETSSAPADSEGSSPSSSTQPVPEA